MSPMIGNPFLLLDSVDSTNIHAMKMAADREVTHGTVFFAAEQRQGKGQRGRAWQSRRGENLIMSVVLQPEGLNPAHAFPLSCATALACYDFFSSYAGQETCIKWPNDLYWGDRKAGGILIENIIRGSHWPYAVVGIGININQTAFAADIPNPVSLKQITGKDHDPVLLAKELCHCLQRRYDQLLKDELSTLLTAYNRVLYARDKVRKFRCGTMVFEARVISVQEDGTLTLQQENQVSYAFGEIEWLPERV